MTPHTSTTIQPRKPRERESPAGRFDAYRNPNLGPCKTAWRLNLVGVDAVNACGFAKLVEIRRQLCCIQLLVDPR
jgi:hypothetical protein